MNRGPLLYVGVLLTVLASFMVLVTIPHGQLGSLEVVETGPGQTYPVPVRGLVAEGRAAYISDGCVYCHSQQVRPDGFGADLERGWGMRRTVARDYLFERPHLLGTMRTGPDLANIGARQPDATWHYLHLYNPRITSQGSLMPPFGFLFEHRQVELEVPADAIEFPPEWRPEEGVIVPTRRAEALVAYLKSLSRSAELPEVPQ